MGVSAGVLGPDIAFGLHPDRLEADTGVFAVPAKCIQVVTGMADQATGEA